MRFEAPADTMAPRLIDITIAFHAANGPVTFGDQKDAGGAFRVASELRTTVKDKMLPGAATS